MVDRMTTILDAAETRIRKSGYNGFSFRDIASDVGIKSSSVHYHFATKSDLAAAVAVRYTDRFLEEAVRLEESGLSRPAAWKSLFRRALTVEGRMCLCGILAAEYDDLPEAVSTQARRFFEQGIESLNEHSDGFGAAQLAQLEGAMLMARSMGDTDVFDQATLTIT